MSSMSDPPEEMGRTADLQAALEGVLSTYFAAPCRISALAHHAAATRSSFALEELRVSLEGGAELHLVLKDLSRRGMSEETRRTKPDFLYNPLREIRAYREILSPRNIGAVYYGEVVDRVIDRVWLLLEKVPGLELYYMGLETWRQTASWLATFHGQFQAERAWLASEADLVHYSAEFYHLWMRRARAFLHQRDPHPPAAALEELDRLARRYEDVVERLLELPKTFIHGEFYASNVLVQQIEGGLRVCPVDWEMAAVGPGLIDLAALIAGSWTADEKEAMAMAYFRALPSYNEWPSSEEAFLRALDYCRLHLAVQWLGWSPEWVPPPEHSHDWLNEALGLMERLQL
jgi:hypothetical protein